MCKQQSQEIAYKIELWHDKWKSVLKNEPIHISIVDLPLEKPKFNTNDALHASYDKYIDKMTKDIISFGEEDLI